MDTLRRWIFRPKRSDSSLLAQFFYADRDLNLITEQLEKFDGHKNVEQFTVLLTDLRKSQDSLLLIIEKVMDEAIPESRSSRDFRVKFPDDILQESLAGRLWFGAECLAAGSSIINHEIESVSMQPLAKLVTKQLGRIRTLLRDQSLRSTNEYTAEIRIALVEFDNMFSEFELCYVSAMVPVKTMKDYDLLQDVAVLFSETVQRALRLGWLAQDQLDMYDPALMFTIPRMAVICGLLVYPEGPLNPDMSSNNMSEMFRPFQQLLRRIRDLLWTLDMKELWVLEMLLSKAKDPSELDSLTSFEELNCAEYPWLDDVTAYDCRALEDGTRPRDGAGSKLTLSRFVRTDGSALVDDASEISRFFDQGVHSCVSEDLGATSSEDVLRQDDSNWRDMPSLGSILPVRMAKEPACTAKTSMNISSYETSLDCRSPRTDPNVLSTQISDAIGMSDCSAIQRISCGCQDAIPVLDRSASVENSGGQVPCAEKDEDFPELDSLLRQQRKPGNGKLCESDSTGVSVYDSLEISVCSAQRDAAAFGYDWDRESYINLISNSSSLCCDDNDDEDVKSAIEVAETSAREEMRSQFKDSMDLIHRLFVCISGIADQLQTNFASDLRHILKAVFDCHTSPVESSPNIMTKSFSFGDAPGIANRDPDRPRWIPDDESPFCMSCQAAFTFMRRRHHCRNCGKVFCGHCSPNTVPLPHFGHEKPVRVCNHCFLFCVTPFTISG